MKRNLCKIIIKLLVFPLILFACKIGNLPNNEVLSEKNNVSERSIQDHLLAHYNFLNQTFEADGVVYLQSYTTFPMQNNPDYSDAIATAYFTGNQKNSIEQVKINDVSLPKIKEGLFKTKELLAGGFPLKQFYGQEVSLSVKNVNENENLYSLYLPKMIKLDVNVDEGFKYNLEAGNIIKWNKDNLNKNGVVFVVEYDPDFNPNTSKKERITKVFASDDTGSYTIREEDIKDLPKGASIKIMVGRLGFKSVVGGSKVYALYGFSVVALGGVVK